MLHLQPALEIVRAVHLRQILGELGGVTDTIPGEEWASP